MKKLCTLLFALFLFARSFAAVPPIEGPGIVCLGNSVALTDSVTIGIWSSNNVAVLTITDMGMATGVAGGTATVTYSTSAGYVTRVMTVALTPGGIDSVFNIVVGDSISLADTFSGTWSSSNPPVATVGSTSGYVLGISAGSAVITFTLPGCYITRDVAVYDPPSPIGGLAAICENGTSILTDTVAGGTWASNDTLIASIDSTTGMITGILPGTTTITYQLAAGIYTTLQFSVSASPAAVAVIGTSGILAGYTVSLSDTSLGGTWSSSNTAIATIDSTGIVQGITAGTVIITYTIADGCQAYQPIVVYDSLPQISTPSVVCTGIATAFSDTVGGGIWSSSDTTVAVVDSAGMLTGITTGTVHITYTIDTNYVTLSVTVNQSPTAIQTGGWICPQPYGIPYALVWDSTAGGLWSSNVPDTAVVDSAGLVTGGPGFPYTQWCDTVIITYTIADGCYAFLPLKVCICEGLVPTVANTNTITVYPNPVTTTLTIQSSKDAIKDIRVTDLLGRVVYRKQYMGSALQVDADCSLFPAGIYFVQVNGDVVRKFVKEE